MNQSNSRPPEHRRTRPLLLLTLGCLFLFVAGHPVIAAQKTESAVRATGCFLRIKDQAQIPARERGVLDRILVEPGQSIHENDLLGSLDDHEAKIALKLAEIDLAIATRKTHDSVEVEIAKAAALEAEKLLKQAQLDSQIAKKMSESDLSTQLAEAALTLAKEEYERAVASKKQFDSSVPELEMANRLYKLQKSTLEVKQAQQDRMLDGLRSQSRVIYVEQQEVAERRLGLVTKEAMTDSEVGKLTVQQMREALAMAKEKLNRREIRSPLTGIVVEKLRHRGEWVEAGDPVLRVIRLDSLLVEGFVPSDALNIKDQNRPVEVVATNGEQTITVTGKLIFVSPEVDSVNGQIQVKAEIKNHELQLLPGDKVEMTIHTTERPLKR